MEEIILNLTDKEKQIVENNIHIKNEEHENKNYKDTVCLKPWGYEFLVYENKKVALWFLNIKKGHSTSLHCHFKKDTIIFVIKGQANINLIDGNNICLGCMSSIFLPKYNFHGLSSFSDETFLLEMEIYNSNLDYTDKNDLLRINDIYKRKSVGYEGSINTLTDEDNLKKYNYFYLNDEFHNNIEGVEFKVTNINQTNFKLLDTLDCYNILIDGSIFKNMCYFREGTIIKSFENIQFPNDNALVLTLKKNHYNEDNKVIYSLEQLKVIVKNLKDKKIILSSGCYDIIHVGHLNTLREAKNLGDILIICLSSDEQIKALKGKDRPINNFKDRLDLFKTIVYVDYIIVYNEENIENEETLGNIMKLIDPYYWVKGSDYTEQNILKKHPYLKRIKIIKNIEDKSTTNIIKKIHTHSNK